MKIIITENQLDFIKKHKAYAENNTFEIFSEEVKKFIYNLMKGTMENISDYWVINGINKSDLYKQLKRFGIIEKVEVADEQNNNILVPKNNFDKKLKRLYTEIFQDEDPGLIITEDGEGGNVGDGATTCFSSSGSYEVPISSIIRRKFQNN